MATSTAYLFFMAVMICATSAAKQNWIDDNPSQQYYDEEIYYLEENVNTYDYQNDITFASYEEGNKKILPPTTPNTDNKAFQDAEKRLNPKFEKVKFTRPSFTLGCDVSNVVRTSDFCRRNLENAKEAIRYLDENTAHPRSHSHGWQLVCRLVKEYKFCVAEMLSDCRNVTDDLNREVTINIRAEGFDFCFSCAVKNAPVFKVLGLLFILQVLLPMAKECRWHI